MRAFYGSSLGFQRITLPCEVRAQFIWKIPLLWVQIHHRDNIITHGPCQSFPSWCGIQLVSHKLNLYVKYAARSWPSKETCPNTFDLRFKIWDNLWRYVWLMTMPLSAIVVLLRDKMELHVVCASVGELCIRGTAARFLAYCRASSAGTVCRFRISKRLRW